MDATADIMPTRNIMMMKSVINVPKMEANRNLKNCFICICFWSECSAILKIFKEFILVFIANFLLRSGLFYESVLVLLYGNEPSTLF